MARVKFSTENKVATTNFDFPRLKLKNGERARILLLEDPVVEYVHSLNKPVIQDGKPVTVVNDGRTEFKMAFVGRPLCLGDETKLAEEGADPKNCPVCKLAKENPDMAKFPQRRYAMHVIRYRTKSGGFDVAKPFAVETLVWAFTDRTFNKIVDFMEEWGDLRKHDLTLGPCENEMFQKFDISVSAKAEWMADDSRKKLTIETFKEGQIPDLTVAVGKVVKEKRWLENDIADITAAWREANGAASDDDGVSLDDELGDLLSGGDEKWADGKSTNELEAEKAASKDDDLAGLLDGLGDEEPESEDEPEEKPAKKAPAKKPAAKEEEVAPEDDVDSVDNFDDLLAGL